MHDRWPCRPAHWVGERHVAVVAHPRAQARWLHGQGGRGSGCVSARRGVRAEVYVWMRVSGWNAPQARCRVAKRAGAWCFSASDSAIRRLLPYPELRALRLAFVHTRLLMHRPTSAAQETLQLPSCETRRRRTKRTRLQKWVWKSCETSWERQSGRW